MQVRKVGNSNEIQLFENETENTWILIDGLDGAIKKLIDIIQDTITANTPRGIWGFVLTKHEAIAQLEQVLKKCQSRDKDKSCIQDLLFETFNTLLKYADVQDLQIRAGIKKIIEAFPDFELLYSLQNQKFPLNAEQVYTIVISPIADNLKSLFSNNKIDLKDFYVLISDSIIEKLKRYSQQESWRNMSNIIFYLKRLNLFNITNLDMCLDAIQHCKKPENISSVMFYISRAVHNNEIIVSPEDYFTSIIQHPQAFEIASILHGSFISTPKKYLEQTDRIIALKDSGLIATLNYIVLYKPLSQDALNTFLNFSHIFASKKVVYAISTLSIDLCIEHIDSIIQLCKSIPEKYRPDHEENHLAVTLRYDQEITNAILEYIKNINAHFKQYSDWKQISIYKHNRYFEGFFSEQLEKISSQHSKDCKLLGVKKNANENAVKQAYQKILLEKHPDKNRDTTINQFQEIQDAYERLMVDFKGNNSTFSPPQPMH